MAETTQYTFELSEVIEALIKKQGLHAGKWTLGFEMALAAGLFGSPPDAKPGTMAVIQRANLVMIREQPAPPHLTVDAAEVNPL